MRKLVATFILLLLAACSNNVDSTSNAHAIISEAQLTDREQLLVELLSEQSFLFDLIINNSELSEIYTTVDYYEHGNFVKTIQEQMTSLANLENRNNLQLFFLIKNDEKHQQWKSAILMDEGYVSSERVVDTYAQEELRGIASAKISSDTALTLNEKRVIASIVKTNKEVVSSRVDITTEEEIKQATDYEEVYLISIELK